MTRAAQKDEELKCVEAFKALFPAFPEGSLDADGEKPDVLVRSSNGKTIGIEVRRYFDGEGAGGSERYQSERACAAALKRAQQEVESKLGCSIYLGLVWHGESLPRSKPFAQGIARLVEARLPPVARQELKISREELAASPEVAPYVTELYLTREPGFRSDWWSQPGGWVGATTEELQSILAEKSALIPKYRRRCEEVWLFVVGGTKASTSTLSGVDPSFPSFGEERFRHEFDRAFLFDIVLGSYRELYAARDEGGVPLPVEKGWRPPGGMLTDGVYSSAV